jgi:hypothetical protein
MTHAHRRGCGSQKQDVYDFLRKQHLDYLAREYKRRETLIPVEWYASRVPYPLDRETADAVRDFVSHFVLPAGLLEWAVEQWVYPRFHVEAIDDLTQLFGLTRGQAARQIPTLEMLRHWRTSDPPDQVVSYLVYEFAEQCDVHQSVIMAQAESISGLAGSFLIMPFLPLGTFWLSRVPLVNHLWIDAHLLSLAEACARLHANRYTRLPASDFHPLAWHRFYRPGTRWTDPRPAPAGLLEESVADAQRRMTRAKWRRQEVGGRLFLHVDDYARWTGRCVPGDLTDPAHRQKGLVVHHWNAWVLEYYDNDWPVLLLTVRQSRS